MTARIGIQQARQEVFSEFGKLKSQDELIKQVAMATLKELVVSLVFATVTAFFIVTPMSIALLFVSIAIMGIFNTVVRAVPAYTEHLRNEQVKELRGLKQTRVRTANTQTQINDLTLKIEQLEAHRKDRVYLASFFCPATFALIDYQARGIVTHEAGHTLAALALYRNPRPTLTVTPYQGGLTSYFPQHLSTLGQKVGEKAANLIVTGAGAGISLIFSTIALAFSRKYRESHPEASRYLLATAITNIAAHIFYALSAFWTSKKDLAHDFISLWAGGIHPIVSIIAMVAIPLIVRGGMLLYDQLKKACC